MPVTQAWDWLLIAVTGTLLVLSLPDGRLWALCLLQRTGRGVILRPSGDHAGSNLGSGTHCDADGQGGRSDLAQGALVATIDQTDILKPPLKKTRGVYGCWKIRTGREPQLTPPNDRFSLQKQQDEQERATGWVRRKALSPAACGMRLHACGRFWIAGAGFEPEARQRGVAGVCFERYRR